MLKDLKNFTRKGMWLAVIVKNKQLKVVASARNPEKALEKAEQKGYSDASLMMSSNRYASWTTQL